MTTPGHMPSRTHEGTPHRSSHALRALDLSCRKGWTWLFKGLQFEVAAQQALWVRGANGQGKTSLLRILAGLGLPQTGRVECDATRLYIGHHNAIHEDLTAQEALAFLARLHEPQTGNDAVARALDSFGLRAQGQRLVRTLSQGQRRRVALARLALTTQPAVWILDEPWDALDEQGCSTLNAHIERCRAIGGSVIFTSHQHVSLPDLHQLDLAAHRAAKAAAGGLA